MESKDEAKDEAVVIDVEQEPEIDIDKKTLTCYVDKKVYAMGSDEEVIKSIRAYISTMDIVDTDEVTFTVKRGFPKRK